jgi:hypothetical protein
VEAPTIKPPVLPSSILNAPPIPPIKPSTITHALSERAQKTLLGYRSFHRKLLRYQKQMLPAIDEGQRELKANTDLNSEATNDLNSEATTGLEATVVLLRLPS